MADPEIRPKTAVRDGGVYLVDDQEVVRRGLRHLLESDGLGVSGESGSAREAIRRIPALRPDLVIVDDDLPDGSGAAVCRAITLTAPGTRCLLITGESDEAVLIDSILAGASGCLSKQDDNKEQLRLIRRALAGHTAFSARFHPALLDPFPLSGPRPPDDRLLSLTRQEMSAAMGLGRGLSNREISQEMFLAEKTVKNLVSTILMKLGMARRTQVAVLVSTTLNQPGSSDDGDYRFSRFPDLVAEVTAALLICTSEARSTPPTDAARAMDAGRLAEALAAARTGRDAAVTPR